MINSTITPEPTLTGIRFGNRIIGYSTAVRQIDNGNYDKRIPDGLDLIACIMEGIESGWFMPPCSLLRSWRRTGLSMFRMTRAA